MRANDISVLDDRGIDDLTRGLSRDGQCLAVDTVDAGVGDLVLTAAGSSARQTNITKDTPVDSVIMSVIDSLEVDGEVVFRKS